MIGTPMIKDAVSYWEDGFIPNLRIIDESV